MRISAKQPFAFRLGSFASLLGLATVACHAGQPPVSASTPAKSPHVETRAADCFRSADPSFAARTHPVGTVAGRVTGLKGRPFGIGISATGVVFVTQQDANSVARVRLADLRASTPIAVGADPGDVVFTSDGARAFVSNYQDGTVRVIDVASGRRMSLLRVAPENAYRLALSPDDARLFVTSSDGHLYAVDPAGRDSTISVYLGDALQGIAIARTGGALLVSNRTGTIWRLNACTLRIMASTSLGGFATQEVALAPDERELFVANENGAVDVLSATTLAPIRHFVLPSLQPFGLSVTPDGTQLYVTSPGTGALAIVDGRTGEIVRIHHVGGVPRRIAFDATGSTAVVANEGNWVDVIR